MRQSHIKLSDELHRKLRLQCADEDCSLQQFVERMLEERLKNVRDGVRVSIGVKRDAT